MSIFIAAIEAGAGAYLGWETAKSINDWLSRKVGSWLYRKGQE